jgi:hypothetical protein
MQEEEPPSVSQSFSFIFAQESMSVPSKSTIAPAGVMAPSEGGLRLIDMLHVEGSDAVRLLVGRLETSIRDRSFPALAAESYRSSYQRASQNRNRIIIGTSNFLKTFAT